MDSELRDFLSQIGDCFPSPENDWQSLRKREYYASIALGVYLAQHPSLPDLAIKKAIEAADKFLRELNRTETEIVEKYKQKKSESIATEKNDLDLPY